MEPIPPEIHRVYTLDPLLQHPWVMLRAIARDVWAGRELAWRLFVRDISAAYRRISSVMLGRFCGRLSGGGRCGV